MNRSMTGNTKVLSARELQNYRRKLERQREIRRKFLLLLITAFLIIGFAFCFRVMTTYASTGKENPDYKYYSSIVVKSGDSLWSIAKEYAGTYYNSLEDYISEVAGINHLKDDQIRAGQYLIVPYYSQEFVQ